jgi:hypothetical protein
MTQLAVNERYCMTLARRTGLPVAEVSILRTPQPVLAVARFDRSFCYRWPGQTCCVVRSYCATMHKQGANIFESHVAAFKAHRLSPASAESNTSAQNWAQ